MDEYTLPTEPGYYLDKEDDLWRLTVLGEWVFPESDDFSDKHERYAPFTRLMTESQWEMNHAKPELSREQIFQNNHSLWVEGYNAAVEQWRLASRASADE